MLMPHWPPGNFQTKCHALGTLLNNCTCFSLFLSLSFSSTCLSPPVPSHAISQESQARYLLLWIRWSCWRGFSLWVSTLWFIGCFGYRPLDLWVLWSVLQGQSHFLHWRLVTFHANHIATEHLLWWDEQFFIFWCYLYYVLITGRASRT